MKKVKYIDWKCPVCGDECSDPENKVSTVCHNGHTVFLQLDIVKNGYGIALKR